MFRNLVDDFFNDVSHSLSGKKVPVVDKKDNEYVLKYEFPGTPKKDVSLTVEPGSIIHVLSIGSGVQYSRIQVKNTDLNLSAVSAKMEHGLLSVTIPLKKSAKPRNIQIE